LHEQSELSTPDFRVALMGREVSLVEWDPRLNTTSILARQGQGGTRYADLWFVGRHGDHDVLVTHDHPDGIDEQMREVLCEWATVVGHRRIWFPKDVVELDGPLPECRRASTICRSCDRAISAEGLDFWSKVRACGTFPNRCSACGGILPQWLIEEPDSDGVGE
jgi:hypothetical protein